MTADDTLRFLCAENQWLVTRYLAENPKLPPDVVQLIWDRVREDSGTATYRAICDNLAAAGVAE